MSKVISAIFKQSLYLVRSGKMKTSFHFSLAANYKFMQKNKIQKIISIAKDVYRNIGSGFSEDVYDKAMLDFN